MCRRCRSQVGRDAAVAEVLASRKASRMSKRATRSTLMREKGPAEEGSSNLSHQKAQAHSAWEEIERLTTKRSQSRLWCDRIKGGLTVDIRGRHAFLPGSQMDLRPIRNLDGMKGQTLEVAVIKLKRSAATCGFAQGFVEGEQNEKRSKGRWSIWKKDRF